MEQRRRVPRLSAGWFGICHIEGESDPDWRDCQVIDISMFGLGITLHHFWPMELVGRRISVEAPAVGESLNVRLEGVIRNAEQTSGGVIRVGIEFGGLLSESELAVATVLGALIPDVAVSPPVAVPEEKATDYATTGPNA
jgi:PilZ domain